MSVAMLTQDDATVQTELIKVTTPTFSLPTDSGNARHKNVASFQSPGDLGVLAVSNDAGSPRDQVIRSTISVGGVTGSWPIVIADSIIRLTVSNADCFAKTRISG